MCVWGGGGGGVVGWGGWYSEFCLLHRLGLFLGGLVLIFTILEGLGGKRWQFLWGIGHLQVFLGVTQNYFFLFWWGGGGGVKILDIFAGIVRTGVRTFC